MIRRKARIKMAVIRDSKENKCKQCQHYNTTFGICHLENIFKHCDYKPIEADKENKDE